MIPYEAQDAFSGSDIYDLSDFVIGGDAGTSNVPIKALLDRTLYCKNRLMRFEDIKLLSGNYAYDFATDERMLIVYSITNNRTFTLPDVTSVPVGHIIPITTRYSAIKALTIKTFGTQLIADGIDFVQEMYMHDAERLWLVAMPNWWEVAVAYGNFHTAGESFGGRKVMHNCVINNGNFFNRADMPRLTKFVLSLTDGSARVSDATWLSNPGGQPVYRGCFSNGDGTTTLRLPDERGLFDRYLDLGRGFDTGRLHDQPGGHEKDAMLKHDHTTHAKGPFSGPGGNLYFGRVGNRYSQGGGADQFGGGSSPDINMRTGDAGDGTETRPKNIGKIPQTRF